jgi:SpoVK/Ycf46/Vps4 family AAA+-type ATPase
MANSLRDLLFGGGAQRRELVEAVVPKRTFDDVILPASTLRALHHALTQIEKHDVLFHDWGLAERHTTGLGLAFNFAGPPGTGKTICAEAIANRLGRTLLVVRYAELESMWAGNTGKNVTAVFRWAAEENAVLFFDEADAVASRRFARTGQGYEREANALVNVLLRELEEYSGVVIFATNLAANFDPAFERRIRNHILFEMPAAAEREQIWRVQLHARKTPLAEGVDFRALADSYAVSGGDIKNAVLKAAQMAISEPGPDREKRIHQHHFEAAIREVIAAKSVMEQSLFGGNGAPDAQTPDGFGAFDEMREEVRGEIALLAERLEEVEQRHASQAEQQRREIATLRDETAEFGRSIGSSIERSGKQLRLIVYACILAITLLIVVLLHTVLG